jgi:hypothetical protein
MLRGPLWFLLNFGGFGLLVGWSVELGLLLGALLATVRLVRGQGGRRAARGFAGMTVIIILANLTGCLAQSFYPPMLYLNLVYPALFLITNLIGWPLIGVLTGLIGGGGAQWRRDPASDANLSDWRGGCGWRTSGSSSPFRCPCTWPGPGSDCGSRRFCWVGHCG